MDAGCDRMVPLHWTTPQPVSMQSNTTRQFWSSVVPASLGTIATALVTLVFYRLHPDVATVAILFLLVVVVISLRGSLVASVWVIVVAIAFLYYFFTPPILHLWSVRETLDVVVLIGFLITALVINRLIFRMRRSSGRWSSRTSNFDW
jgi:two-component system, OmpR family, sensor histidine kinase KdpD